MKIENSPSRLAFVLPVLLFLYATNYHLQFKDAIEWVQANDVFAYLHISESAPRFPSERIAFHFSQRWIPHYLIGIVSDLFSIDLGTVYVLSALFIIFSILWVFFGILQMETSHAGYACLLFLILSVSSFSYRLVIFMPGLFADLVCVLGLVLSLRGLIYRKVYWILFGMVVATLGKQLSLLILPGVLLFALAVFSHEQGKRAAFIKCFWICSVTIGTYSLLIVTSANFAHPNTITREVLFAIFPWVVSDQFSVFQFTEHVFRVLVPLFPFIGIFILTYWRQIKVRAKLRQRLMLLENISLILMVLGPMAYAFLPGPQVQMGTQSRYVVLSMFPMTLLTLRCLPEVRINFFRGDFFWLGITLCGLSFHHRYTVVHASPVIFITVHLLSLLCLLGWFASAIQANGDVSLSVAQDELDSAQSKKGVQTTGSS